LGELLTKSDDDLSRKEANIARSFGLVIYILDTFKAPFKAAYLNYEKKKELREKLGDWKDILFDANDKLNIPILPEQPFEKFLKKRNFSLSPAGARKGNWGWALLLHALNITPDSGILERRFPFEGFISASRNVIEAEVDGKVICHIVNLYGAFLR
jgi:hypothetical protein